MNRSPNRSPSPRITVPTVPSEDQNSPSDPPSYNEQITNGSPPPPSYQDVIQGGYVDLSPGCHTLEPPQGYNCSRSGLPETTV